LPNFLEDFARLVNERRNSLSDKIFKGKLNLFEEDFKRYVFSYRMPLEDLGNFSCATVALKP
jgi:hypothetical protein